jgi:hypothetical protein
MGCCLRRIWSCLVTVVVLLLIGYLGFKFLLIPVVSSKLEQTVRDEFQLDDDAVVVIRQGPALNALRGKFDFLMLKADNAVIDDLPVEDLLVRADAVTVDIWQSLTEQRAEITGLGEGFIEFKVAEEPLAERWADELAKVNLDKPELTLDEGFAKVTALFALGPLKQKITVSGKIEPTAEGEVRFSASGLEVAGAELNLSVLNNAFKTLDPVVDLGQLQLEVDITKVTVDDGFIYVAAESGAGGAAAGADETAGTDDIEATGGLAERLRKISLVDQQRGCSSWNSCMASSRPGRVDGGAGRGSRNSTWPDCRKTQVAAQGAERSRRKQLAALEEKEEDQKQDGSGAGGDTAGEANEPRGVSMEVRP